MTDKLRWLNHHYPRRPTPTCGIVCRGCAVGVELAPGAADLARVCGLLKERAQTLNELAELAHMFYVEPVIAQVDREKHLDAAPPALGPALAALAARLADGDWSKEAIAAALKATLAEHGLKMPQLAIPVRLKVFGTAQTPSVDAVLAAMPRETVLARLHA